MSDIDLTDDEHEETPSNGRFSFRGLVLEPHSFDRQGAFEILSTYGAEYSHALIVYIGLLSHGRVTWILGNRSKRDIVRQDFASWCDKNRITMHPENAGRIECERISEAIWADMKAADFKGEETATLPDPKAFG